MSTLTPRALRLDRLFLAAAIYLASALLLKEPIPVPGRSLDDVVVPLMPLLLIAGYLSVEHVMTTFIIEVRNPHRTRRWLFVITFTVALLLAVAVAAAVLGGVSWMVQVRNGLAFFGLVLLMGPRNSSATLLFLVVYGSISWVLGAGGQGLPPAGWAVPMAQADSLPAAVLCGAIFIAGTASCLRRKPLTEV